MAVTSTSTDIDTGISLLATGDILVMRHDPDSMFAHARSLLQSADIVFGQLESPYSDKGSRGSSGPRGAVAKDPSNRPALARAGFDVLSLASNHTGDWGSDALLDCMEQLRGDGIRPIGAGADIVAARSPAIIERNGRRIAFLAYCSVAPEGYYAATGKPGCAPMRAFTHYEPFEPDQPGNPARIFTFPHEADLAALIEDIRQAKQQADFVYVSMHWGIRLGGALADYQRVVAHAAVDAGADAILGHHPHVLKAIEVYRGKTIFYSLGNFAMDKPSPAMLQTANRDWLGEAKQFYSAFEELPKDGEFGLNTRFTMVGRIEIRADGTQRTGFVPCLIDDDNQPVPVSPLSPEGREVTAYVAALTEEAGISTALDPTESAVFIV